LHENILVTHLYKYTIVSKNKFILDIRSFFDGLIAFFGLTRKTRGANVIDLIGKMVIVEAEDGITYTGKLVEIGEEEVHLESEMGWVVIMNDRIANITEKKV
jgi:hypothetical protein